MNIFSLPRLGKPLKPDALPQVLVTKQTPVKKNGVVTTVVDNQFLSEDEFINKYHANDFHTYSLEDELDAGVTLREVNVNLSSDLDEFDTSQRDALITELSANDERFKEKFNQ